MEQNPIANDARRASRERYFGPQRACVVCGDQDPSTLKKAQRSLLEEHHVAGEKSDADTTVTTCLNCHRKVTERLRSNDTSMDAPRTMLDRLVSVLLGLSGFFQMLSDTLSDWVRRLAAFASALDTAFPAWRTMAAAQ